MLESSVLWSGEGDTGAASTVDFPERELYGTPSFDNSSNDMLSFIFSPYAFTISGVFVWTALFLTCFQIFQHLRYYSVPDQQLWIVRILFIIPIYGLCSWVGLILSSYSVYFDAVRSCYEAFVIYNFLRLCLAYLGGETAILAQINGKPIEKSVLSGTCCFPKLTYSIKILRFCKQATLQFCIVKPVVAVATIILEATGSYHQGDLNPRYGYFYCTLLYNLSVTLALYGLILFYTSTRELLSKYNPVLKFFSIKMIVFLSFWQGLLLTVLQWFRLLNGPMCSSAYQNFLITIEMFFAAILLRFAFPYKMYMDLRKDDQGRGIPMKKITSHFKDTLNPHDVVDDAIHNFSRVYQKYAQQGDMSEDEDTWRQGETGAGLHQRPARTNSNVDEDEDRNSSKSPSPVPSSANKFSKLRASNRKRSEDGFEKVTLLVESDEDEIL